MKKMMMLTTTAYMSERFNKNNILILIKMGYEVHVVANFEQGNPMPQKQIGEFKEWIKKNGGMYYTISVNNNPYDIHNQKKAYKELLKLVDINHYSFIHCHTPVAGVLGRLVAKKTQTKCIYTAHGFHFYKGAPLVNWLLYFPIEKYCSSYTDVLITINKEDYLVACKRMNARKVEYVPGVGVALEQFYNGEKNRMKIRESLNVKKKEILMISVGELSKRKNHEAVIRAIALLDKEIQKKMKYIIVGQGKKIEEYRKLINEFKLEKHIFLLGYRTDIADLYEASDICIFPSLQEGLPVALMEAIAARIPVICSAIRGNIDLISNNDFLFNPNSLTEIVDTISFVSNNDNEQQISNNYNCLKKYDVKNVNNIMKKIYMNISNE